MPANASEHEIPLQRMEKLSIVVLKGGGDIFFNEVFRHGMIGALTGAYVAAGGVD